MSKRKVLLLCSMLVNATFLTQYLLRSIKLLHKNKSYEIEEGYNT